MRRISKRVLKQIRKFKSVYIPTSRNVPSALFTSILLCKQECSHSRSNFYLNDIESYIRNIQITSLLVGISIPVNKVANLRGIRLSEQFNLGL